MIEIRLYLDERGRSPFEKWRIALDAVARARISRALERLVEGNTSNVKGLSGGVSELKIDTGPGYRVYFGRDGAAIVVLLGGGTKKDQQDAIANAARRWRDYKRRAGGASEMPLTKSFKEMVLEDMRQHPEFAQAMLREGVDALISGELDVGKTVQRDFINATIGFDGLAKAVDLPSKSLMRMFGRNGNPQMQNLFAVIGALQRHAGIELRLADGPAGRPEAGKRAKQDRVPPAHAIRYPVADRQAGVGFEEPRAKFRRT